MINITRERKIDYSELPEHIQDGMELYIEEGVPPGSFCKACLEDSLVTAFGAADDINIYRMKDIVMWLYNSCPSSAQGSESAVKHWIERGGLKGSIKQKQETT